MAGDPDTALPLATEGLAVARSLGNPSIIGLNLAALAGALADSDPDRATALLREDIQRWASLDYENGSEIINAALISARIRDWPTALELAPRAIRHLHWIGDRPQLAGILNILARVLAPNDPESAAVIQGAARRLATAEANESVASPPAPVAPGAPPRRRRPRRATRDSSPNSGGKPPACSPPRSATNACARCAPRARRWTPTKSSPTRSTRSRTPTSTIASPDG